MTTSASKPEDPAPVIIVGGGLAGLVTAFELTQRGVRCIIVPATQRIHAQAAREGLLETFADAGAIIGPSTCGACAGLHMGALGDDEVAVATTNRN